MATTAFNLAITQSLKVSGEEEKRRLSLTRREETVVGIEREREREREIERCGYDGGEGEYNDFGNVLKEGRILNFEEI
ncbi:conserved hypothetical protein [Ricinus communis]|uniref:Uncharacterized protein n=1 Tax=Ricinus communis TaxID=3988 RepID=B9RRW7_RICCO|nr:conserved hypothetical protein [Ricinus communis]